MAKDISEAAEEPFHGKPEWAMSGRERRRAERARQGLPPPRRRWPWVVLALVVAAGAAGWTRREEIAARLAAPVEEPVAAAGPEAPLRTQINRDEWEAARPRTLRRTVKVIGTLGPARRADLSAEASGRVEAVLARAGDAVREGDLLVQVGVERLSLEADLARSNLAATQSQLSLAQDQLARAEELVSRGVAAETTLAELRSEVERLGSNLSAQEDQVAVAELALEGARLEAPFDGIIASRSVETGNFVAPGTPLLSIVDLRLMEMRAAAPVSAGAAIRPGQRVVLRVDGIEGRGFEGVVDRIAPVAEEGTRTLTVFVRVENQGGPLLGGMFATGEVVTEEAAEAIAVPAAAIREEGGPHVLAIVEGVLRRRDVTVAGLWPGGLAQVEGLRPGEAVVTADLPELSDGEAVELVEF